MVALDAKKSIRVKDRDSRMGKRWTPWRRRSTQLILYTLLMLQFVFFSALSTLVLFLSTLPSESEYKGYEGDGEFSLEPRLPAPNGSASIRAGGNRNFMIDETFRNRVKKNVHQPTEGFTKLKRNVTKEDRSTVPRNGVLHSWRSSFLNDTQLISRLRTDKACRGKEQLLSILYAASATKGLSERDLTSRRGGGRTRNQKQTVSSEQDPKLSVLEMKRNCPALPMWEQVTDMYGKEAVVVGMDTCKAYRQSLAANNVKKPKVRIAGNFDSGTTVLAQTLHLNFPGSDRNVGTNFKGNNVEFDVPWGKHVPPMYKWTNKHPINNPESPEHVFPIVIVRNPYTWLQSMCKESYDAVWERKKSHCPNLVRDESDPAGFSSSGMYPVHITYEQTRHSFTDWHASASDFWGDWIRNYYDSDEPRLFVRFEDLLFHAEDMMYKIAECVGLEGEFSSPFKYVTMASKKHGQSSDFQQALTRYGHPIDHLDMTHDDLEYAKSWTTQSNHGLDAELMEVFHYHHPDNFIPVVDPS